MLPEQTIWIFERSSGREGLGGRVSRLWSSERLLFYLALLFAVVTVISLVLYVASGQFPDIQILVLAFVAYALYKMRRRRSDPVGSDFYF